jgi:hypothetical protein
MKIYVITNDKGDVVSTARDSAGSTGGITVAKPIPLPGQKVHHIELPKEFEELKDAGQLHKRLRTCIHTEK